MMMKERESQIDEGERESDIDDEEERESHG